MRSRSELKKARQYFKAHPDKIKYDRKDSGLSSSYIQDANGNITRLGSTVLGAGGFGRVKETESNQKKTVTKIQTKPYVDEETLESIRFDLEQEAAANLDFGIATGPLIERIDEAKQRVKYYQEMIPLNETLDSRLKKLNPKAQMQTAIKLLMLIQACHEGKLTKSSEGYAHGDISTNNVMYDQQGNMRLIDFAFSKKLTTTNQLRNDNRDTLYTLFHAEGEPRSVFDTAQFTQLPIHIQKALACDLSLDPDIAPEQLIIFTTAVLIQYSKNPEITAKEIEDLKLSHHEQILIVEQYKRKEAILQIPESDARALLKGMVRNLERYQGFLIRKSNSSLYSQEKKLKFEQKEAIISQLLTSVRHSEAIKKSPQEMLAIIDNTLLEHESTLSPHAFGESKGVLSYIQSRKPSFTGKISTHTLTQKIDKQVNMSSNKYRMAMQELRSRSDTVSSSASFKSDSDSDFPKSGH